MKSEKKDTVFVLDTSAILSGKPIDISEGKLISPIGVSKEIRPGGRTYRNFQFLKEKKLRVRAPLEKNVEKIKEVSKKTGDLDRLSDTDLEVLALAYEIKKNRENKAVILTDDYSIQNVACELSVDFENISQKRITKKFKWFYRCSGCGKKFKKNVKRCPICGSKTKAQVEKKQDI
ncbi:MAG: NOB1 family endonuclease [Candidatus Thermoplasmatota archaeon]